MLESLPVDDRGDKVTSVSVLARSVFADGATNWGRIVSLVAFGVVVCQNSKKKEDRRLALVESVGEEISAYLLTDQKDWLLKNNSWVSSRAIPLFSLYEFNLMYVCFARPRSALWSSLRSRSTC